jgi:hypothetical protein
MEQKRMLSGGLNSHYSVAPPWGKALLRAQEEQQLTLVRRNSTKSALLTAHPTGRTVRPSHTQSLSTCLPTENKVPMLYMDQTITKPFIVLITAKSQEDVEKLEPSHRWGIQMIQRLWNTGWQLLNSLNLECDLEIPS